MPRAEHAAEAPTIHLLVSSLSAAGRSLRRGRDVAEELIRGGWHVKATVSTPDDDPEQLALQSPHQYVGALGGDGFIAAVAPGTHATGKVLVPFPGGQGNDLCRALGLSADMITRASGLALMGAPETPTHAEAITQYLASRTVNLDAIRVQQDGQADHMALGLVSLGLDARANILANQSTMTGPMTYTYGTVKAIATYRPVPFTAIVDGEECDVAGWLLSLSNSGVCGGGIRLGAESDPTDGKMELIHAGPHPLWKVLPALARILRRQTHPLVTSRVVKDVTITGPEGTVAMADGDPIGTLPIHASLVEGFTRVLV